MVVDDDEGLRLLISDSLRAEGYTVSSAESGKAAVAALKVRRPDLLLLDLQLNDMSGTTLLDLLKQEALSVPFIVVTGQGDEKVAVAMMKQGALDYVMKDTGILDLLPPVIKRAFSTLEGERSLVAAQSERRRLEREVLDISEKERQRFGADLHDGLGQQLTAIELMCVGLKNDVAALDPRLGRQLERISGMLREAVSQTRALARGLSPLDEQPEALQNGLAELAKRSTALGFLECSFHSDTSAPVKNRATAGHLYRIAQEAVNNAVKHSGAKEVAIRFTEDNATLVLEISDNGRGLPRERPQGMGFGIMHYRAGMIGAKLTVESKPGKGVRILCTLPTSA